MELRDSFIHDGGSGPDNSGFNFYGNYLYGANANAKIENNIFNKDFPAIELNNSSSGFYIGYNYEYGSPSQYGSDMVTWSFDDGHAAFNIMNLYEGNIGEMMGADNYFGGSGYGTVLRNYFTGYNPNFGVTGDAVWLDRLAYYYNVVGNVLGSKNQAPKAYSGCNAPAIYRLGMPNLGNCGTTAWDGFTPTGGYPDPKVSATLLRWGNYDYLNKTAQFNPAEIPSGVAVPTSQTIPNSYAYTSTPSWWPASIPWPPIGPDVTGGNGDTAGHVYKIPAQVCWESSNLVSGGQFNAATCYGSATVSTAPAVTSALSASGTVGQAFSYQITASNSPTSYSATGLPAGLSVNASTGAISGTPTTAGSSSVSISAVNAKGTGTATLALTVSAAAVAPTITSATSATGTVGTAFSYQITASNSPTSLQCNGAAPRALNQYVERPDLRNPDDRRLLRGDDQRRQRQRTWHGHAHCDHQRCCAPPDHHQRPIGERHGGPSLQLSDHRHQQPDQLRRVRSARGTLDQYDDRPYLGHANDRRLLHRHDQRRQRQRHRHGHAHCNGNIHPGGVAPRDNDNADERRDSNRPSGQRLDLRHGDELLRDGDPEKRVERE